VIKIRYTTALFTLAALLCPGRLPAIAPPAPGVELPAGFGEFFTRANRGYLAGHKPQKLGLPGHLLAAAAPASLSLPVILASFADLAGSHSAAQIDSQFFGSLPSGSMKEYYAQASGGRFTLSGRAYGWFTVAMARVDYLAGGPLGDEKLFPLSPGGFVTHAVKAADSQVDFSRYDNDGPDGLPNSGDDDGVVDALIVVHPGGDAAQGATFNFWSHTSNLGPNAVISNDPAAGGGFIKVDLYSLVPELAGAGGTTLPAGIGVFCHEFGHQLGLPDLYGPGEVVAGSVSYGIGNWGLMGTGSYGGDGRHPERPVYPCAWSRLRLGWLDAVVQDTSGPVTLDPVSSGFRTVRVWDNDDRDRGYFLLECRTRTGFDSTLPGEGLLIWHVDESVFDNENSQHKLVDLEQADGLDDIGRSVNTGDAGDPFPGSSANIAFTGASQPSSARYGGAPSGVEVTAIEFTGGQARFQLGVPARPRYTLAYDEDGPGEERGFGYGGNLAHAAVVFTSPADGALEAMSTYFAYDSMEYTVEIYTGIDSGWLRCPVSRQSGQAGAVGWRTIELKEPVRFGAGDTLVAVVGYRSRGFDEGWPVPVDWTGRPQGRSFANFSGLGRFEPVGGDVSLRAVIRPGEPAAGVLSLDPWLGPLPAHLDFGPTYAGEIYSLVLPLHNYGYRPLALERVEVSGGGYSLPAFEPVVNCGGVNELTVRFDPAAGGGDGEIKIAPAAGDPSRVELTAGVAGYSVRYDSVDTPAGIDVFTEAAHGAVLFSLPRRAVVAGVRTFVLQDSMKVSLRLWGEAVAGRGRCLLAETLSDTLFVSPGWHQLFLPKAVDVDSGDTFVADVRYETPGRPYNYLIPVDTLRAAPTLSYYNLRESEAWLVSLKPVAIRALVTGPDAYTGEVVLKRARPEMNPSHFVFDSLVVGREAVSGVWLCNRGSARLEADVLFVPDGKGMAVTPGAGRVAIACEDSVYLELRCLLSAPGAYTGLLELKETAGGKIVLEAGISAAAAGFEIGYDENGFTATAGFNSPSAAGAVIFTSPWDGTLSGIRLYLNQPDMTAAARVFRGIDSVGAWSDTVAEVRDTVVKNSGWQTLPLDRRVTFADGDSFAVAVTLAGSLNYPLSIDHRGTPSGRSQAAASLTGKWEVLGYDLNLRAVLGTPVPALFAVSGSVTVSGRPLAGAQLTLYSGARSYRASSGEDGAFDLPRVVAGSYELQADFEGYRFKPLTVTVDRPLEGIAVRGRKSTAGDVDSNGRVDIFDLLELLRSISGRRAPLPADDVDSSGRVDVFDLIELLAIISGR